MRLGDILVAYIELLGVTNTSVSQVQPVAAYAATDALLINEVRQSHLPHLWQWWPQKCAGHRGRMCGACPPVCHLRQSPICGKLKSACTH
jgi:hypothetical protein